MDLKLRGPKQLPTLGVLWLRLWGYFSSAGNGARFTIVGITDSFKYRSILAQNMQGGLVKSPDLNVISLWNDLRRAVHMRSPRNLELEHFCTIGRFLPKNTECCVLHVKCAVIKICFVHCYNHTEGAKSSDTIHVCIIITTFKVKSISILQHAEFRVYSTNWVCCLFQELWTKIRVLLSRGPESRDRCARVSCRGADGERKREGQGERRTLAQTLSQTTPYALYTCTI